MFTHLLLRDALIQFYIYGDPHIYFLHSYYKMSFEKILFELLIMCVLNVAAVYIAAFNYRLSWAGVVGVMSIASLATAMLTDKLSNTTVFFMGGRKSISEALGSLLLAAGCSIAVLLILTKRFNFPEALGISLLAGGLTSFLRFLFKEI